MRRIDRADLGYYLGMFLLTAVFLFPLLWVFSLSLKTGPETLQSPPSVFPEAPQWSNYSQVADIIPIGRYLANSLLLVLLSVGGALAVGVPAAYALSRFVFPTKRRVSRTVLAAQLISPIVLVVPLYRLFVGIGLINNYVSLVLVYIAITTPFMTWFLKDYFDTIPVDLDEAALIDGCTRMRTVLSVIVPVARPGIASAAILGAVTSWSQFVVPFVLLDERDLYPVSVGVVDLQSTTGEVTTHLLAAGSLLAVFPVILLFVVLQRQILGALTSGAVKG